MGSLFSKPDPPTPPNPIDTARAQTGSNVSTAVANAYLGNINQVTPGGSLNYSPSGTFGWQDPTTNQTYNIPTFTATQTLSPQGQAIQDQQLATQFNLGSMANAQSAKVAGLLANPMDPNFNTAGYFAANPGLYEIAAREGAKYGMDPAQWAKANFQDVLRIGQTPMSGWQAPTGGNANQISGVPAAATSFSGGFSPQAYLAANPDVAKYAKENGLDPIKFAQDHYKYYGVTEGRTGTGQIQSDIGPVDNITKTYGPADNFSADRQRVEESLMTRMNPQLQIEQQRLQQQLADQGIRYGSQAYSDAMLNYSQQANDARYAAIQQAGAEQQRMNQMAGALAAFQNQAQQQGYEQQLGRGQFANAGQAAQFAQNAQLAQFGNAGLAQQLQQQQAVFNAAQAQRNQYMQEQYAGRNQPLNEISALLSGSQIAQPNFVQTPGAQIPTTDVANLVNQNFNQQLGLYTQQSNQQQALLGGILGLGGKLGGAALMSDRREKENISRIGSVLATDPDRDQKKLPIYQYSYKKDPASIMHTGPMAQDVEKVDPSAVKNIQGRKYLDMRRMGSVLGVR